MKNGLSVITTLVEHICRVINAFHNSIHAAINFAAEEGKITAAQRDTLNAWIDALQSICALFKIVSGY